MIISSLRFSWKNWKRRWFVLSDRCLYYFQHTAEKLPKGVVPLENVKVRLFNVYTIFIIIENTYDTLEFGLVVKMFVVL